MDISLLFFVFFFWVGKREFFFWVGGGCELVAWGRVGMDIVILIFMELEQECLL